MTLSFRQGTVARQDHRRLESLIDMHLAGGYDRVRNYSLATFLRSAEAPLNGLYTHVGLAWLEPGRAPGFAGGLSWAFRLFAFQQGLIRNLLLGRLSFRLFPICPLYRSGDPCPVVLAPASAIRGADHGEDSLPSSLHRTRAGPRDRLSVSRGR